MRETERRIKRYQARLPRVREKIFASLALFVLAVAMLGVATFSWITLSIAPETQGITTTIAANGNLEIALANSNGTAPDASLVGDGALSSLLQRNTKWGNLVNLSDPAYGLDKVTLRPAILNSSDPLYSLLEVPFAAADFAEDGRVKKDYSTDFKFTVYDQQKGFIEMLAGDENTESNYSAVKAVSYGEVITTSFDDPLLNEFTHLFEEATRMLPDAGLQFHDIALGGDLDSVTGLLGSYLNSRINDTFENEVCKNDDVIGFYQLVKAFYDGPMITCGKAYMKMFEMYQLKYHGLNEKGEPNYTPYTDIGTFCKDALAELEKMGYPAETYFPELDTFISDWNTISGWFDSEDGGLNSLYNMAKNGQTVTWGTILPYVDTMVDIDTAQMGDGIETDMYIKNLSASNASSLTSSKKIATVNKGMIYNMDSRVRSGRCETATGAIRVTGLSVSVKVIFNINIDDVTVVTSAPNKYPIGTMTENLKTIYDTVGAKQQSTQFTALDTYGYAIDFWVRTNAEKSYLTLEGKVETKDEPVMFEVENASYPVSFVTITTTVKETDANGTESTVSTSTEEEVQAYQKDNVWYYVVDSSEIESVEELTDEQTNVTTTITKEVTDSVAQTEKVVIGYSGVNRVWNNSEDQDAALMSKYSTSQGSGSCYTFYSDDPNTLAQSLEILSALRVAFIDADANLLAIASLDTTRYFSQYGKVTIPLVLNSDAIDTGLKDEDREIIRGITLLEQNEATFICALVYLDGAVIGNEQALSSQTIHGQFNIQFGSTASLDPMTDDELQAETREVSASVKGANAAEGGTSINFSGNKDENREVTVTINMTGATASSVSANFTRQINKSQGARQETMNFTSADGGKTWTATTTFAYAGTYLLRELTIDGDAYTLEEPCTVIVDGFTVNNISLAKGGNYAYRTADSSVTETIKVTMSEGPNGDMPEAVKAVFVGDNDITVITELTKSAVDGETWEGKIRFTSSGTYKMNYLIMDNEVVDENGNPSMDSQYFDINATYTRTVFLGLRVSVSIIPFEDYKSTEYLEGKTSVLTGSAIEFFYEQNHKYDVSVIITDESGKKITGLNNVALYYTNGLDANLIWSAAAGKYVGSLTETKENPVEEFVVTSPGEYLFDRVTIENEFGKEEIKIASYALTIHAYTKDPLSLEAVCLADKDYVVALSDGVTMPQISFEFSNAATAKVYGLFEKTYGNKTSYYVIPATRGDTEVSQNSYIFQIPRVNGYWELKEVKMSYVFYDDDVNDNEVGIFYSGSDLDTLFAEKNADGSDKTMVEITPDRWNAVTDYFDLTGTFDEWSTSKVVAGEHTKVKIVSEVTTQLLEYPGSTVNSNTVVLRNAFMESVNLPAMKITIQDFEGKPIEGVEGVSIGVQHVVDSARYTTAADTDFAKGNATGQYYKGNDLKPTDNGDGTYTLAAGTKSIWFDGTYNVTCGYKIGSGNFSISGATIDLQTTMPSVAITAISPTGTFNADKDGAGKGHASVTVPAFTATDATVYFSCSTSAGCGTTYHNYSRPSVTITLSNYSLATSVTLNFGSGTHVYNDTTQTGSYTWTGNGTCKRNIGYFRSNTASTDSKTPAGNISATSLVLTYGGVDYTYDLANAIQIHNPY